MGNNNLGRLPDGTGLSSATEPKVSALTGFDPSRKLFFSRSEVCGALAMWAVRQSPYAVPDNLEAAIAAFNEELPEGPDGWFWATEDELREMVSDLCLERIPEIMAWNVPKSGHGANFVFSSRYDQPDPDDDIIDLHALSGNICRTLLADQYQDGETDNADARA